LKLSWPLARGTNRNKIHRAKAVAKNNSYDILEMAISLAQ
jgi:hypothetical protein